MRLIDFDEAVKTLSREFMCPSDIVEDVLNDNIPTIEAESVRHGRWISEERDSWSGGGAYICSACGYGYSWGGFFEANDFNYCPNCGAKMDGGDAE